MPKSIKGLKSIRQLLDEYDLDDKGKYITKEFQDYGYRLSCELNDENNKSLYIKLAKEVDRNLLEKARNFIKDASNVKSKARLFMWKLKQLKEEKKRVRLFISGQVQGVFFRAYTKKRAEELGIAGWVRNLEDGRVEVVFEGRKDKINQMLAWCEKGPPASKVDKVEEVKEKPEGLVGFEIER